MDYKNKLLRKMSADDVALLEPHMERCSLELGRPLEHSRKPISSVYFIERGIGSILAGGSDGRDTEVGLIGFEGMTGSAVVMGDDRTPHACRVLQPGEAIRIEVKAFSTVLSGSYTMRPFLLRYVNSLQIQATYTALANTRSYLEERLARWLLMCDDRMEGAPLAITHELISTILGVRRPGVTVALQLLERQGLICASRGSIRVRSRDGLIQLADGGYGKPEAEYKRLLRIGRREPKK